MTDLPNLPVRVAGRLRPPRQGTFSVSGGRVRIVRAGVNVVDADAADVSHASSPPSLLVANGRYRWRLIPSFDGATGARVAVALAAGSGALAGAAVNTGTEAGLAAMSDALTMAGARPDLSLRRNLATILVYLFVVGPIVVVGAAMVAAVTVFMPPVGLVLLVTEDTLAARTTPLGIGLVALGLGPWAIRLLLWAVGLDWGTAAGTAPPLAVWGRRCAQAGAGLVAFSLIALYV